MRNTNEQPQISTRQANDRRAFMLDAVSGALPFAGAILAIRNQAWWLLFFTLARLGVALALASQTARGQSWVFPQIKCWHLAVLTSLVAMLVVLAPIGLD